MKPRQLRLWILWLLPLAVARSLVPTGFMLAAAEHGFGIVMCSGFGPVSGAEHSEHHGAPSNDATDRTPCPYALAGSACPTVAWRSGNVPAPVAHNIDFSRHAISGAEPSFLDRIRGPPFA